MYLYARININIKNEMKGDSISEYVNFIENAAEFRVN